MKQWSAVGVAEEVLKGEREGNIDAYVVAALVTPACWLPAS